MIEAILNFALIPGNDFITEEGVNGTVQRRERFLKKFLALVLDPENVEWYDSRWYGFKDANLNSLLGWWGKPEKGQQEVVYKYGQLFIMQQEDDELRQKVTGGGQKDKKEDDTAAHDSNSEEEEEEKQRKGTTEADQTVAVERDAWEDLVITLKAQRELVMEQLVSKGKVVDEKVVKKLAADDTMMAKANMSLGAKRKLKATKDNEKRLEAAEEMGMLNESNADQENCPPIKNKRRSSTEKKREDLKQFIQDSSNARRERMDRVSSGMSSFFMQLTRRLELSNLERERALTAPPPYAPPQPFPYPPYPYMHHPQQPAHAPAESSTPYTHYPQQPPYAPPEPTKPWGPV